MNAPLLTPNLPDLNTQMAARAIQNTVRQFQAERRLSPRHEFRLSQWIGPISDGALPRREDYFPVECVDISTGGFAFLLGHPPNFTSFVIVLDLQQPHICLAARVVHVRDRSKPSHPLYEIGCQFLVRL